MNADWSFEDGQIAVEKFAQSGKPYTALFAGNDLMALGAIYALQDRGFRVPQDVAVIGYDDRAFTSFVRPSLTTITLPAYEMGEAAAKLLLSMMKNEVKSSKAVEVRGRLLVRDSCGASISRRTLNEDMA
ncbi:MAG: substrate-binding domain-containing protein [Anaerolineaceae bacterium]|nr:substrate-binding domain-containing protein [Anaerolineaceae bacterium]